VNDNNNRSEYVSSKYLRNSFDNLNDKKQKTQRNKTKRNYLSRRSRQQSLPSLTSPKSSSTVKNQNQSFTIPKPSTGLLAKSYSNISSNTNATRSKRKEEKIKRRAKIIKDLEEAQKWNNFIKNQIKPLERSIDRNLEQLQKSWLLFSKILYFYKIQSENLMLVNLRHNAARTLQIWWKYTRKEKFLIAMQRCINIIRRQRGRFKLSIKCWQRSRAARIVREFITDTSKSRFATAMKRLRWNIIQAQRAARSFLKCKEARIHSLFRVWIKCERRNRSKLLELQKDIMKKKKTTNLDNIVEEKKKYQKLRVLAFTNDTAETRWKKTLRDPSSEMLDPSEANKMGQMLAFKKRNESLFDSVARVAQHVNIKRYETLHPEISLLHKEHNDTITREAIPTDNSNNKTSKQDYKKKKRHYKFKTLRPWAKKTIESFNVDYVDPQFVSDYHRFIILEQILEEQRNVFAYRSDVVQNSTIVTIDDVKNLIWKGSDYQTLVNKKKIQSPILCLYTGVDVIANKNSLLNQIKKAMLNAE
jgi:hypothetical protein